MKHKHADRFVRENNAILIRRMVPRVARELHQLTGDPPGPQAVLDGVRKKLAHWRPDVPDEQVLEVLSGMASGGNDGGGDPLLAHSREDWWPMPRPTEDSAEYLGRIGRWLNTDEGMAAALRNSQPSASRSTAAKALLAPAEPRGKGRGIGAGKGGTGAKRGA